MASTNRNSVVLLKQEVSALKQRVRRLENALRRRPVKSVLSDGTARLSRELEEAEARRKAVNEFFDEKDRKRFLEHPELLAQRRKQDREINAFLRSRGVKPLPSRLPKGWGKAGAAS